jgi:hypothetical protein
MHFSLLLKKFCDFTIKTNKLVVFREKITNYFEDCIKTSATFCKRNVDFVMTEAFVYVSQLRVIEIIILKTKSENTFQVFTFSNINFFFLR